MLRLTLENCKEGGNNMWTYNYTTELWHHGIMGMKWGIRRYQNPDGTLTIAGKIRYGNKNRLEASVNKKAAKLQRKYNDLTGKSIRQNASTKDKAEEEARKKGSKSKSVSEMSSEELQAAINRINLEKTYMQAMESVNPRKVSRGQKFIDSFKDQAVNSISKGAAEALGDVVKGALTKSLKKSLGLADSSKDNQKKKVNKE